MYFDEFVKALEKEKWGRDFGWDFVSEKPKQKQQPVSKKVEAPVDIKRVDFNGPATIIFWTDDTKTVSVCEKQDVYDKEKGFLIAYAKKNAVKKNKLIDDIDKWLLEPKEEKKKETKAKVNEEDLDVLLKEVNDLFAVLELMSLLRGLYKI